MSYLLRYGFMRGWLNLQPEKEKRNLGHRYRWWNGFPGWQHNARLGYFFSVKVFEKCSAKIQNPMQKRSNKIWKRLLVEPKKHLPESSPICERKETTTYLQDGELSIRNKKGGWNLRALQKRTCRSNRLGQNNTQSVHGKVWKNKDWLYTANWTVNLWL